MKRDLTPRKSEWERKCCFSLTFPLAIDAGNQLSGGGRKGRKREKEGNQAARFLAEFFLNPRRRLPFRILWIDLGKSLRRKENRNKIDFVPNNLPYSIHPSFSSRSEDGKEFVRSMEEEDPVSPLLCQFVSAA